MDKDLIIEALSVLIEKKNREADAIAEENEYYFQLWTEMLDGLASIGGRPAIEKAISGLSDEHKARLKPYLDDNFDAA